MTTLQIRRGAQFIDPKIGELFLNTSTNQLQIGVGFNQFITLLGSGSVESGEGGSLQITYVPTEFNLSGSNIFGSDESHLHQFTGSVEIFNSITASSAQISNLNYPTSDGTSGQFLSTDGGGNLSFTIPDPFPYTGSAVISGSLRVIGGVQVSNLELNNGGDSVFIGDRAGENDDASNNFNVGIGHETMYSNISGSLNVSIGYHSLRSNTEGGDNTAIGYNSLFANSLGNGNVAIGNNSFSSAKPVEQGESPRGFNNNVAIGYEAGSNFSRGSNVILIGYDVQASNNRVSNEITIGNEDIRSFRIPSQKFYINDEDVSIGGNLSITGSLFASSINLGGLNFPNIDGEDGQFLSTDGQGNLTFNTIPEFVSFPYTGSAIITGSFEVIGNSSFSNGVVNVDGLISASSVRISDLNYPTSDGNDGEVLTTDGLGNLSFQPSPPTFPYTGNALIEGNLDVIGEIDSTTIRTTSAQISNLNYPTSDGNSGQVLSTDGSGNLRFQNQIGGNGFPFTGSAEISGSLNVTGSTDISDSLNVMGNISGSRIYLNFDSNLYVGENAGFPQTGSDISHNTAVGINSLINNISGSYNTAIGSYALYTNDYFNENTSVGYKSLYSVEGRSNTAIGFEAGIGLVRGSNNIFIGYQSDPGLPSLTSEYSNFVVIGNDSNTNFIIPGVGFDINRNRALIDGDIVNYGNHSVSENLLLTGSLIMSGSGNILVPDGNITISNGSINASSASIANLNYPIIDGEPNQVLSTDGSGNLRFQNQIGGNGFPFTGSAEISGSLNVIGTITNTENLNIGGDVISSQGSASFGGNLDIGGYISASNARISDLNYPTEDGIDGQVLTTNGLGNLTFQNPVTVDVFPYTGSAGIEGSLYVSGSTIIDDGNLQINGSVTSQGEASFGGNGTFSNNLEVGSLLTANSAEIGGIQYPNGGGESGQYLILIESEETRYLSFQYLPNIGFPFTGSAEISGSLNVIGTITNTENLNIGGDVISSQGSASFGGNLDIGGYISASNARISDLNYPTEDGIDGQFLSTDGLGNLTFQTPITGSPFPYEGDALILGTLNINGPITASKINLNNGGDSVYIGESAGEVDNGSNSNLNVGIGFQTLSSNTLGAFNVALGYNSMFNSTNSSNNVSIGYSALFELESSNGNTAIGYESLRRNLGSNNTAIGNTAASSLVGGDNNTLIGYNAEPSTETVSNEITLGDGYVRSFRIPGVGFDISPSFMDYQGTISASLANISDLNYPTTDGTANQVITTDGNGNLSFQSVVVGNGIVSSSAQIDLANVQGDTDDVTEGLNNLYYSDTKVKTKLDSDGVISGSAQIDRTWTLGADGSSHYTFTGPGLTGTENDPTLYLTRGETYRFVNEMGAHPFRIQSDPNGSTGTQYNDGVTNNDVSNGTLIIDVQFDAPSRIYYQCTVHPNMGGVIEILDKLPSGVVSGSEQLPSGLVSGSSQIADLGYVSSTSVDTIQVMTAAAYSGITPVSGVLYIIQG